MHFNILFTKLYNSKLKIQYQNSGRWKRMRLIMNPTFSSAKLKEVQMRLIYLICSRI